MWRRLFLICVPLMTGCAAQQQLDVYLTDLEPQRSTALEQRVLIKLRLQNPTDRTLEATGLNVRLDVNGGRLATGVSNAGFTFISTSMTRPSTRIIGSRPSSRLT